MLLVCERTFRAQKNITRPLWIVKIDFIILSKDLFGCDSNGLVRSMLRRNESLKKFLDKWPGKRLFGIFRFLPIFFCLGAALEYSMINWDFKGQVNFYRTYKKRQIQDKLKELIHEEEVPVS